MILKTDDLTNSVLPHGAQWAIEETAARQLWQMLQSTNAVAHREEFKAEHGSGEDREEFDVFEGVAVIRINGLMTKRPTSLSGGTSTVRARRAIRQATRDKSVDAILVAFDSPGGAVSGTADLAADIAAAAERKTTFAYVEDCCCSAAYWAASQAQSVFGNPTSMIGSIGTYMVVEDWSKFCEKAGIKVHVISTGKFKGAAAPGSEVTDEQLAEFQRTANELNEHFLSAIARGRSMTRARVEELADGTVHIGQNAVDLGLIDGIASMDDVIASMVKPRERTTVSGGIRPRAGLTLAEESEMALAALQGLTARIAGLQEVRRADDRELSANAKAHLSDLLIEIDELQLQINAMLCEAPDPRQQLVQTLLRTSIGDSKS